MSLMAAYLIGMSIFSVVHFWIFQSLEFKEEMIKIYDEENVPEELHDKITFAVYVMMTICWPIWMIEFPRTIYTIVKRRFEK